MRFIQLRSAPAQNAGPLPASTTARTETSASICWKVLVSSAISASSKALRTSGRFSVMRPTPPFFSTVSNGRLHGYFALDGVGDEALLVRPVVQRAMLFLAGRSPRKRNARPQRDLRHPGAIEQTGRLVDVLIHYQFGLEREMQKPKHVALRDRGDEGLLRIDARAGRRALRDVARRGASGIRDARFEAHVVHAAVARIDEFALALPFDRCAVLAHMRNTPKRVFSIGALRAAEMASPSTRRLSAGAMTPPSPKRALAEEGWAPRSYCSPLGGLHFFSASFLRETPFSLARAP